MASQHVVEITNDNFQTEVIDGGTAYMLDFYATWCGPCKAIAPMVDELAQKYAERGLRVGKVDADQAQQLAVEYGVQGLPTLLFFKGGQKVDALVGKQAQAVVERSIEGLLG